MTLVHTLPAFLLLTLPWLNPFAPGPSPAVVPWLVALAASGGLLWIVAIGARGGLMTGTGRELAAPAGRDSFAQRWAPALAWALLCAGALSSLIGLLQYFGVAAPLEPWVREGTFGEAFSNLRQRNQFASLTNLALVAALWLAVGRSAPPARSQAADRSPRGGLPERASLAVDSTADRESAMPIAANPASPTIPASSGLAWQPWALLLGAMTVAAGNAASSSRTGLLQLVLLAGLLWLWGGWRRPAQRRVYLAALGTYAVCLFALPYLAGFDMSEQGLLARLRDGAPACSSRLLLWRNVLDLISQKPLMGWGWGALDLAHYQTLYDGPRFCEILDNAHNLPLHLAVELGLPAALLACGGLLWWLLRQRPWHEADATRQMAWGLLAVIGLHSLLEYPLWYGPFQMTAVMCLGLLHRPRNHAPEAVSGSKYESNWPVAQWLCAGTAIILIALSFYAAWDYHRVSQLYLAPSARDAAYVDDTLGKVRGTRLFANQVRFAELTTSGVTRANAPWVFGEASELLRYSPEPRVIEKVIESAVMLGKDDEALLHLARYRAAFPKEHAAWARLNSRMPEVIDSLNQAK